MFIPVLAYHKVDWRWEWGITRVTPRQFERQMTLLHSLGYHTITLKQYLKAHGQQTAPVPERSVVITFDDAYRSLYDSALPVLQRFRFIATAFVVSDYVGLYNTWDVNLGGRKFQHLTWDQLKELADLGFEIGAHGATHRCLTTLKGDQLAYEALSSKTRIERNLGCRVEFFSFPFGKYSKKGARVLQEGGYVGACVLARLGGRFHPFRIPRRPVYLADTLMDFLRKLRPGLPGAVEDIKSIGAGLGAWGTVSVKSL